MFLCPTLKRRRGHGWRGDCPAADMPAVAVASLAWFGEFCFLLFRPRGKKKQEEQ